MAWKLWSGGQSCSFGLTRKEIYWSDAAQIFFISSEMGYTDDHLAMRARYVDVRVVPSSAGHKVRPARSKVMKFFSIVSLFVKLCFNNLLADINT